jgi:hypothetical protein
MRLARKKPRRTNQLHYTAQDFFGGGNRPVFSGLFGCARPGLEIGEKNILAARISACRFALLRGFHDCEPLLSAAKFPHETPQSSGGDWMLDGCVDGPRR